MGLFKAIKKMIFGDKPQKSEREIFLEKDNQFLIELVKAGDQHSRKIIEKLEYEVRELKTENKNLIFQKRIGNG